MLDYDLAEIYGYEVKRLNDQVKRNIARFPEDFMFQLSKDELPENFVSEKDLKNFVIYKDQKFEANAVYIDIYQQASGRFYESVSVISYQTQSRLSR